MNGYPIGKKRLKVQLKTMRDNYQHNTGQTAEEAASDVGLLNEAEEEGKPNLLPRGDGQQATDYNHIPEGVGVVPTGVASASVTHDEVTPASAVQDEVAPPAQNADNHPKDSER